MMAPPLLKVGGHGPPDPPPPASYATGIYGTSKGKGQFFARQVVCLYIVPDTVAGPCTIAFDELNWNKGIVCKVAPHLLNCLFVLFGV